MLHLHNAELSLTLLDPRSDPATRAPRFCRGGFLWQAATTDGSPLFSGPEFPALQPSPINGQGAPEVFQFTLCESDEEVPPKKLVLGVGLLDNSAGKRARESHFSAPVERFAPWSVEQEPAAVRMATRDAWARWAYALHKDVHLHGRTVFSFTHLVNEGTQPLPFRWFAHPFLPVAPEFRCVSPAAPWTLPDNPGFHVAADGSLRMLPASGWAQGHYQLVPWPAERPLEVLCSHPTTGSVRIRCDFPIARLALWANDRTFSIEPFRAGILAPGEQASWSIRYSFDRASA